MRDRAIAPIMPSRATRIAMMPLTILMAAAAVLLQQDEKM